MKTFGLVLSLMFVALVGTTRATPLWIGTNYDVEISSTVPVGLGAGGLNLVGITLTAVGKNGALPNTFDSTKSGAIPMAPNPGITTSGNQLHQIWLFGGFVATPTSTFPGPPFPQELDTHFLVEDADIGGIPAPTETRNAADATEHADGGFGDSLVGVFTDTTVAATIWDFAYIVVAAGTTVSLDFEIGAPTFGSETVEMSFTAIPEPSGLILIVMGLLSFAVCCRNSRRIARLEA